jgi:hypothetical protein
VVENNLAAMMTTMVKNQVIRRTYSPLCQRELRFGSLMNGSIAKIIHTLPLLTLNINLKLDGASGVSMFLSDWKVADNPGNPSD